jgi:hypothetical protein
MPATQCASAPVINHATCNRVVIRQMADECTSLLLGARKQRAAPSDPAVHMLRRDLARNRNQAFESLLRIALEDQDDGEETTDITSAFYHAAHAIEARASARSLCVSLENSLKLAARLRANETELTVDVLGGDRSARTLHQLDLTLAKEAELIDEEREAVREKMYGGKQAVA